LLVYGQAGAGKTSLIKTLPHPVVLSAEGGLLSIQDADLPYLEITSIDSRNTCPPSKDELSAMGDAIKRAAQVARVLTDAVAAHARAARSAGLRAHYDTEAKV
jgi:hypothetical protein